MSAGFGYVFATFSSLSRSFSGSGRLSFGPKSPKSASKYLVRMTDGKSGIDCMIFTVSDAEGAIEGATVNFGGKIHKTNASGQAVFKYQEGTYKYTVKHGDYDPVTGALTVSGSTAAKAITLA